MDTEAKDKNGEKPDGKGDGKAKIIINGNQKTPPERVLTYDILAEFYFADNPAARGENVKLRIVLTNPERDEPKHITPGVVVDVRDGMEFDISPNDKS